MARQHQLLACALSIMILALAAPGAAYELTDALAGFRLELGDVKGTVCIIMPRHERNSQVCPQLDEVDDSALPAHLQALVAVQRPARRFTVALLTLPVADDTNPPRSKEAIEAFVRGMRESLEKEGKTVTMEHSLLDGPYDGIRVLASIRQAGVEEVRTMIVYPRKHQVILVAFGSQDATLSELASEADIIMKGAQFEAAENVEHFGEAAADSVFDTSGYDGEDMTPIERGRLQGTLLAFALLGVVVVVLLALSRRKRARQLAQQQRYPYPSHSQPYPQQPYPQQPYPQQPYPQQPYPRTQAQQANASNGHPLQSWQSQQPAHGSPLQNPYQIDAHQSHDSAPAASHPSEHHQPSDDPDSATGG